MALTYPFAVVFAVGVGVSLGFPWGIVAAPVAFGLAGYAGAYLVMRYHEVRANE